MLSPERKNGVILGWMIGDALGTTTEFKKSAEAKQIIISHSYFDKGLVGQGIFGLAPGQFTDDTEMGLAGMFAMQKTGYYDPEETAKHYHYWYASKPFDMGNTTAQAISKNNATEMYSVAKTLNRDSLSNGFLMRLPGLVVLHAKETSEKLIRAVTLDVQLTHGHPEAVNIAYIYSMVLYKIIHGENIHSIFQYIKNQKRSSLFNKIFIAFENHSDHFFHDDQEYKISDIDSKRTGFVGYAIWLLLISMARYKSYKDTILDVAMRGGDTDTNCCIIGAVVGGLYPATIPREWTKSLIGCQCNRHQSYPPSCPKNWMQFLES